MLNNQIPYLPQMMQPPVQQASTEIKWIQGGKQSAMAYPVMPGTKALLFDSEIERFYLKEVGYNGVPAPLREFEYKELFEAQTNSVPVEAVRELPNSDNYMTREEFNDAIKQINEKLDKLNYRKGYKREQSVQQS